MPRQRFNLVTLGCSKNLVDTERVLAALRRSGKQAVHEGAPRCGDIMIINTCGFIGDAKEESVNTILQYVDLKNRGKVAKVYVMGCLSQRYPTELKAEIAEVDGWYGKFDFDRIINDLAGSPGSTHYERTITTPSHHAYVKIAEGCNRYCAFCAIPLITGRFTSRPQQEILDEVRDMVAAGVKEFNIIAQDLSSYGIDLDGTQQLPQLIDAMAAIPGVKWIRLHYAYPAQFPHGILDVMARHDNVCKYLDIALQHSSDKVLGNMRRHITGDETRRLIDKIRSKVPGIHLRTTLMVGFPGEGDEEFEELLEFVKWARFERMGAFAYCEEDDTWAARNLPDDIDDATKQRRLDELMALQEEISMEIQQAKIGQRLTVIIDREENDYYVGRTQWDSPEVDPEVLVKKTRTLAPGDMLTVEVVEALPFELIATPC